VSKSDVASASNQIPTAMSTRKRELSPDDMSAIKREQSLDGLNAGDTFRTVEPAPIRTIPRLEALTITRTDSLPDDIILEIPSLDDELSVFTDKIHAIQQAAKQGYSVAVVTTFRRTKNQTIDPEVIARRRMEVTEVTMYNEWQSGLLTIPHFDWEANRTKLTSEANMRDMERHVAILNKVYKTIASKQRRNQVQTLGKM
jgi:hypothetical protein